MSETKTIQGFFTSKPRRKYVSARITDEDGVDYECEIQLRIIHKQQRHLIQYGVHFVLPPKGKIRFLKLPPFTKADATRVKELAKLFESVL